MMKSNGKKANNKIREIELLEFYYLVPNEQKVQKYLRDIVGDEEQEIVEQCYFISPQVKHVYIFLSLIFGGRKLIRYLQSKYQSNLSADQLRKLKNIIQNQFIWDSMMPVKLLKENFAYLKQSSTFTFVCEEIIPSFSVQEAQNIFQKTSNESEHLFGVKIRVHNEKNRTRKTFKRKGQEIQIEDLQGSNYLTLFQYPNHYVVGMFRTEKKHNTVTSCTERNSNVQMCMSGKKSDNKVYVVEKQKDESKCCCCCCIF